VNELSTEREPYLERMKSSFLSLARAADMMTRDASPKVRPFLRVAFVWQRLVDVHRDGAVLAPFWRRQGEWFQNHKQNLTPVSTLEDSAQHVWAETSPQAGLDAI
jgi:hypothetical protein